MIQRYSKKDPIIWIKKTILQYLEPQTKIFLFGSRARGNHRHNSDYDIGLENDKSISIKKLQKIRAHFEQSPRKIDLIDFTKAEKRFKEIAKEDIKMI